MARGDRFVALGLGQARSPWFREVARWATAAVLPLEFLKCVTIEELRARLRTGRPLSAVLVDGAIPGVDRDLLDDAVARGCAVIVVDDGRVVRDWLALGATAVLRADFTRDDLLDVLQSNALQIGVDDALPVPDGDLSPASLRGHLVAVTGAPGSGASTAAMAVAQGFASDARFAGLIVLADLALDADQAMLHDARDVVPGVQELVDAHRSGHPTSTDIQAMTFAVVGRDYDLMLGLRRHRDWVSIRPRAFAAALDGLRCSYKTVVADVAPDLEGERQCGSIDVEERNAMARVTTATADVVVVTGASGPRGVHRLVRVVDALLDHGVDGTRILPVVNRAPRGPRARSEITNAFALLTAGITARSPLPSPVFLPERRRLDELVHNGARLPDVIVRPLTAAVRVVLERQSTPAVAPEVDPQPVPVAPGSLGRWYEDGEEA